MREGYSRGSCVYQNKERNRAAYPLWVYAVQERKRAMERLTHPRSSGIKTGYWSPNKKDELVERLAAYEDTGLTPEEIERLKEQHRWIPVEERLPVQGEPVWATIKHSEWINDYDTDWLPEEEKKYHPESYGVYKAEYIGGGIWQYSDDYNEWIYCDAVEKEERNLANVYDTVTAWMPLPEPYQGK